MKKASKQALTCGAITLLVAILLLYFVYGAPATSEGAGEAIGKSTAQVAISALITWFLARNKTPPWSWLKFVAIYIAVLFAIGLLATAGHQAKAAESTQPFNVVFPSEWAVEHLDGTSSAVEDRSRGMRERALMKGPHGLAAIEIGCTWLESDPDVAKELDAVVANVRRSYTSADTTLRVDADPVGQVSVGGRSGVSTTLRVSREDTTFLVQDIAMTKTDRCLATITLSGGLEAENAQRQLYEKTLREIRWR